MEIGTTIYPIYLLSFFGVFFLTLLLNYYTERNTKGLQTVLTVVRQKLIELNQKANDNEIARTISELNPRIEYCLRFASSVSTALKHGRFIYVGMLLLLAFSEWYTFLVILGTILLIIDIGFMISQIGSQRILQNSMIDVYIYTTTLLQISNIQNLQNPDDSK